METDHTGGALFIARDGVAGPGTKHTCITLQTNELVRLGRQTMILAPGNPASFRRMDSELLFKLTEKKLDGQSLPLDLLTDIERLSPAIVIPHACRTALGRYCK
jgi:hypothetical protein